MNQVVLRVNKHADGRVLANMFVKVNSKAIRRIQYNNSEHWIIPSYTLPSNVIMNGGLYTAEQIDKHYTGLEGTPAPLGHPEMDGKFISARSPEGLNQGWVGAWNRNVKKSGDRIYLEKWVDTEVAKQSEKGRELLARLEALEAGDDVPPIHTSVAMFLIERPAPEGNEYSWIADIQEMDHDAILLHEVGAATPEQGVGLMVNADKARSVTANAGVLSETSYRAQERRLEQAARDRFVTEGDTESWVFIADFDADKAIVVISGEATVYGYSVEDDKITFEDSGTPVERQESWVRRLPGVNALLDYFTPNRANRPDPTPKESDMPLTKEEMAEITQGVGAVVANALAETMKPVVDGLATIQANQAKHEEALNANSRREEDEMRAVVANKLGKAVADQLSGEGLKEAFKQCGTASPLLNGNSANGSQSGLGVPSVSGDAGYFRHQQ